MKERLYDCKKCSNDESLERIPQMTNIVRTTEVGKQKVGSLVKEHIEENKKILDEEKKKRYDYHE